MITQSESGLSTDNYNSVRDAANSTTQQAAFSITACRYNMDFGNSANQNSANTTNNDGQSVGVNLYRNRITETMDWDVVIVGANQYRAIGFDIIEVYNGTTLSTVAGFAAVAGAVTGSHVVLATDGTNLFAFSLASDGLYRRQYTIGTSTWSAWTQIVAMAGATNVWSDNLVNQSNATATASSTAAGTSAMYVLKPLSYVWVVDIWSSNVAGSGTLTINLNSLAAFTIHSYQIGLPQDGKYYTISYVFEGSNDNSVYSTIETVTNTSAFPGEDLGGQISQQTYKYYRIRFTSWKITSTGVAAKPVVRAVELRENLSYSSQILSYTAANADRVHMAIFNSSNQTYRIVPYQNNAGVWSAKTTSSSEVKYDFNLVNMNSVNFNGMDIIVFQGYSAGRRIVKVDGSTTTDITTMSYGIHYLTYEPTSQTYSHITPLDVIDPTDTTNYRIHPKISINNGKIYIVCYSSDGSSSPVTGYRCYTGYDINAMSAGEYIPLPSGYGMSGVKLIQTGSYVYAWQRDLMYRSLSTDYFGSIPSDNTDSTITSRVSDYQFSMDQGFSGAFVLDNSDGYFDSHAWFNDNNTIQLVHKHGYNISGTDQLIQVAITEIDSLEHIEREGQRQIRVSFRDRIAWVTDKIKSEEPNDTRGPVFGFDEFDVTINSDYAGMGHLALQSGPWQTSTSMLRVKPVKNSNNIIFSTLLQEQTNFYASFIMNDPNGTTTATYGSGLCFRAKDSKNFLYLTFVGSTVKLNKCLAGVYSEISTVTVTTFTTTNPIIVVVEGPFVWIYHKGSSASFTLDSKKVRYGSLQIGNAVATVKPDDIIENEFGRGFIGFISRQSTGITEVTFSKFQTTGLTMRPLSYGDAFGKIAALANTKGNMAYYDFLSGTWAGAASTRSGNQIQVTASGNAYRTDFTLPTNYVIQYKRTSGSVSGLRFLSATDSTYVEIGEFGITYYNGSTTSTLASVAYRDASAASSDQTYYVGVQKTERSGKTMYTLCAWSNHLIGVYAFDDTYTINFNRIAFKGIATYNVYIHEIPNVIDGYTVDPGEPMGGAIQRLMDGREFRLYTRYDGSINLARKENQSSQFTYSYIEGYAKQFDKRALRTHVRVLGANVKAEYIDTDLLQKYGHLFEEQDSPYMMTEDECLNQAKHIIRVMKSTAAQLKFQTSYNPTLEIGDHITVNDDVTNLGEYIITNISASFTPQWECEITARLFVAEA